MINYTILKLLLFPKLSVLYTDLGQHFNQAVTIKYRPHKP